MRETAKPAPQLTAEDAATLASHKEVVEDGEAQGWCWACGLHEQQEAARALSGEQANG